MPSPERFSSDPLRKRRHCCACGRWRTWLDFAVRQWADKEKTIPKYFSSECHACHRRLARERWASATEKERKRAARRCRVHYRRKRRLARVPEIGPRVLIQKKHGDVPRHLFARWIRQRLASGEYSVEDPERHHGQFDGITQFSAACGVHPRYVRSILLGYEYHKFKTRMRRVPIDWISSSTVDRMLQNEGTTTLDDLFPLEEAA
jgi:hypothetical protein